MAEKFKETKELIGESSPTVLTALFWWGLGTIFVTMVCWGLWAFLAPHTVSVQNEVFHQSQAYNDGMARDLDEMRMAYATADQAGKDGIRAVIRHRFAGYDRNQLPPDLRVFLGQVMQ